MKSSICNGMINVEAITPSIEVLPLNHGDALIIVDVQRDFLPGGHLPVPDGEEVIPPLNRYLASFVSRNLPVFISGDSHPSNHCSFNTQGGPWPPHCIVNTQGAAFARDLDLPDSATVIRKGCDATREGHSAFEDTDLAQRLSSARTFRVFIGGLATDYGVRRTTRDALKLGYEVFLLSDAIRPLNKDPQDGERAETELVALGAIPIRLEDLIHA